jgi:cation:H+ antiporter
MILMILGFLFLIKGADLLVDGAAAVARRFGVSDMTIGLTVVGFGTSTPELVVTIMSAVQGTTDLAIGNVIGSNIANVFLILGVASLIHPLNVTSKTVWREIPMSFLAAIVLAILANDVWLSGAQSALLSRSDGLILLSFFSIFIYYTVSESFELQSLPEFTPPRTMSPVRAGAYILLGLTGLVVGGQWIVNGAVQISRLAGIAESIIGLTVVAVGTSLPELATSVVAARKGNADIAVGNVVGSNIFNIFFILGISALMQPLPFAPRNNIDLGMVVASSLLSFLFMYTGMRLRLDRWEGVLFIAIYGAYIMLLVLTAMGIG